jgi:chorismate synthase
LELRPEDLNDDLARRQLGHGRGGRMKIERDTAVVTGGVRHGRTLGGPIAVTVENRDHANWAERMSPWPLDGGAEEEVHLPRPGHADLVGTQKYRQSDVRNILERASARETAARVAGGALCKAFLRELGVVVHSHVIQIASVRAPELERALGAEPMWTARPCAAWTQTRRRRWCARSTTCARPMSRLAGCSRCSRSGSSPASGRTSRGRSASTVV